MTTFVARTGVSCDFALERIGEEGRFFYRFSENIDKAYKAEMVLYRYTFAVFHLNAENEEQCRAALSEAWKSAFPEAPGAMRAFICPSGENEIPRVVETIYGNYYGDAYLSLITELAHTVPLLEPRGAMRALIMRNYLFAVDSGCGFSTMLSSLSDFLSRAGVYGERRDSHIEFIVAKENDGSAAGVDDIISYLLSDESGSNGIVGLDISRYLEDGKTEELRSFIRRLYRFQDRFVFAFRIPFLEKKALKNIVDVMSDMMLLKVLEFPPLHDAVLMEYLYDGILRLGYRTDSSLSGLYFGRIREEKRDGRFYGFKTAEKIVNAIALKKAQTDAERSGKAQEFDPVKVTPDDLPGFDTERTEKTGYEALSELIGMESVAGRIREIIAQMKISVKNDKLDKPCIHMRFLGAPGTGKTTVARIIGQILREEGVLRKGAFFEYSARSLCAEYVGQTAVRTASICREAYGSVLFIDEAYSLYESDIETNDYGKEALTTLIAEMENHRDDMLVIMAGYTDEMETLMKGNTGLRSRMPYAITFPNYTRRQLFEIFMLMVKKHFEYTAELEREAERYFMSLSDEYLNSRDFANARFVRNLYERTWSKAALRCSLSGTDGLVLIRDDFIAASSEKEFREKSRRQPIVGF